jgi:flavin-dependent dehydrogenase
LRAYDVAIVGGGPAGSAAALGLLQVRPELRVALLEASSFARPRIGETLAPGARRLLEGLGAWERVLPHAVESFGTGAVWGGGVRRDNDFVFSARGSGWHVDRARFDAALADTAAAAGAEVLREARFTGSAPALDDGPTTMRFVHRGAERTITASAVIDASGRTACFASRRGAGRIAGDRLCGAAVVFRAPAEQRDTATLVEAAEDGWWYSAAIPGGRLVVAWLSDADLLRRDGLKDFARWSARLRSSRETRARTEGCVAESPVTIASARSQRLARICGERWVAAGDAASAFDPLSGAGILKALHGGKLAAFAVLDLLAGNPRGLERYRAHVEREYEEYLAMRAWFYGLERRWPHAPFWTRRHAAAALPESSVRTSA